jgi:DNA (cytosine-5)-methyltransferase 1
MQAVDLFCGCGGFSRGLTDAGYDIKLGIDYDETILETYRSNFNHNAVNHDLHDWEKAVKIINETVPECNVIVGSPPCTEFSRAGQQMESKIANLTVCFANIVVSIMPRFFIMENVPDVYQSNSLSEAVEILNEYGYSVTSVIKDARHTGVPQNRRRFFMIGCAATANNHGILSNICHESKKKDEIIGVKKYCENIGLDCPDFLYFFPRNKFQAQVVDSNLPYPTMRSTNGVCMNKNPLTPGYIRRPNDAADLQCAATISISLASAISSFPPGFLWPENRKYVGIQLGNCVPPGLAKWIGALVLQQMVSVDTSPEENGRWVMKPLEKVLQKSSHRKIFFDKIIENGGDTNHESIRVKHLENTRVNTPGGAFRNSDIADDPCEIYYDIGTHPEIDAAAIFTMGFELKNGWTFLIKERICQKSRIDDLFVLVPGQRVPFRGKAMLMKNNLLTP